MKLMLYVAFSVAVTAVGYAAFTSSTENRSHAANDNTCPGGQLPMKKTQLKFVTNEKGEKMPVFYKVDVCVDKAEKKNVDNLNNARAKEKKQGVHLEPKKKK